MNKICFYRICLFHWFKGNVNEHNLINSVSSNSLPDVSPSRFIGRVKPEVESEDVDDMGDLGKASTEHLEKSSAIWAESGSIDFSFGLICAWLILDIDMVTQQKNK